MNRKNSSDKSIDQEQIKRIRMYTLAFAIALLPPIWAVLANYIGVSTGAVALITSGVYVANGNKRADALKISIGFLLGDLWAIIALWAMDTMNFHPDIELYLTLFILGGIAVIIGEKFNKIIYTPSWLCGWAIALTIMGPLPFSEIGTLPIQIGVAMIVGVIYVGVGVDAFQQFLIKKLTHK